ncbi:NADH-quinone oxidoreductase subunit C [Methylocaldum sp.]|uniref:hydrogenase large subunit n=1 Tax=Methylocaldum sp. TaxID=1969727 RepID=UPI003220157A
MSVLAKPRIAQPTRFHQFDPVEDLLAEFDRQGIAIHYSNEPGLIPAVPIAIKPDDWGRTAELAAGKGFRWAGGWADDIGSMPSLRFLAMSCLEKDGRFVLLRAVLDADQRELPSQAPWFPGANRSERRTRDAFGLDFIGHPDARRWLRHQAWTADEFPLRKSFPRSGNPKAVTPPDKAYAFQRAQGHGVYEIPVGPVHAGIIEPGHFRFSAVGETVLNLEERLGYVHKGIEKIAEGRGPDSLARLAGRVSGDTTVGHTWAACRAMEQAAEVRVPERALTIRGILAERERIANHLGDIGAICNDVAFAFASYQFSRLRELWLRNNRSWFGHRLLMDRVVPGGVAHDLSSEAAAAMAGELIWLRKELDELRPILADNDSLQDRLVTAGVLPEATARALGCLGFVARASGIDFDLRRDAAYAPYDRIEVRPACHRDGDVAARLNVRYDEIYASLHIIAQLLRSLGKGPIRADWRTPDAGAEGLALVEGWRGEILCYIRFGSDGRISRYYPRDPSVFNWPALERLIHGNIVPDFPLCNKSVNGSYSGHDL